MNVSKDEDRRASFHQRIGRSRFIMFVSCGDPTAYRANQLSSWFGGRKLGAQWC